MDQKDKVVLRSNLLYFKDHLVLNEIKGPLKAVLSKPDIAHIFEIQGDDAGRCKLMIQSLCKQDEHAMSKFLHILDETGQTRVAAHLRGEKDPEMVNAEAHAPPHAHRRQTRGRPRSSTPSIPASRVGIAPSSLARRQDSSEKRLHLPSVKDRSTHRESLTSEHNKQNPGRMTSKKARPTFQNSLGLERLEEERSLSRTSMKSPPPQLGFQDMASIDEERRSRASVRSLQNFQKPDPFQEDCFHNTPVKHRLTHQDFQGQDPIDKERHRGSTGNGWPSQKDLKERDPTENERPRMTSLNSQPTRQDSQVPVPIVEGADDVVQASGLANHTVIDELFDLEETLKRMEAEESELKTKVYKLEKQVLEKDRRITELENEQKSMIIEQSKIQAENVELRAMNDDLQCDLRRLEDELDESRRLYEESERRREKSEAARNSSRVKRMHQDNYIKKLEEELVRRDIATNQLARRNLSLEDANTQKWRQRRK